MKTCKAFVINLLWGSVLDLATMDELSVRRIPPASISTSALPTYVRRVSIRFRYHVHTSIQQPRPSSPKRARTIIPNSVPNRPGEPATLTVIKIGWDARNAGRDGSCWLEKRPSPGAPWIAPTKTDERRRSRLPPFGVAERWTGTSHTPT